MGRFLVFSGLLALMCTSCAPNYRDTAFLQSTGRQKSIVAVLPVINHTVDGDLSWDLSMEFTDELCKRVDDSPKVYLLRDHGSRELARKLSTPNPAMIPSAEINGLGAAEFVIVSELINHPTRSELGSELNISMRVRVIDIRHDRPKVILQEMINNDPMLVREFVVCDYSKTPWGTDAFQHTPLGLAHNKFVREVVSRVENYIEAAR